jgi:hypothetical protein
MSILSLINDLTLKGEKYILQVESIPEIPVENTTGDIELEWIDVKELSGTVQGNSGDDMPASGSGRNEIGGYFGFFEANFEIPYDDLGNYRIKHIFPSNPPFIRFFIIREIDRNLIMDNEYHHYEMDLELSRKWKE